MYIINLNVHEIVDFLLRKGDKDGNVVSVKNINSVSSQGNKAKKGVNKPVLFVIIGAVAVVLIILLVNLISLLKPLNYEYENEINEVLISTNDYVKNNGVVYADENINKGIPFKNIKKLHIEPLNNFIKDGGKGWIEEYSVDRKSVV